MTPVTESGRHGNDAPEPGHICTRVVCKRIPISGKAEFWHICARCQTPGAVQLPCSSRNRHASNRLKWWNSATHDGVARIMKRQTLAFLASTLLVALTTQVTAGSAFYKWTDQDGVTHYTESPPPDGVSATEVRTRDTTSSDQEKALERLQERRDAADKARKRETEAAREQAEPAAVAKERCDQYRENLEILRTKPVVRSKDPETGEETILDTEQREKMIKDAEEILRNCDKK